MGGFGGIFTIFSGPFGILSGGDRADEGSDAYTERYQDRSVLSCMGRGAWPI